MKKLILVGISAVMFVVSLVGFLALQGRLNYEGTKNVPILNKFFHAPATPHDGTGDANVEPKGEGAGEGKHDVAAEKPHETKPKEPDQARAGDHEKAPAREEDKEPKAGLFQFPAIQSSITADELTAAIANLEGRRKDLERREALLAREKDDLAALARDLEERRKAVRADMAAVHSAAEEVDVRARTFRDESSLLKQQEQKNYKDQAERFAAMEPKKAADLLLEMGPEGEERAVKLLASMDAETAAKIISEMDAKRGARIVERSLKLMREPARPEGR